MVYVLNAAAFGRTAAVVRHGRHVVDDAHFDAALVDGADGGFTTGTGTLHKYLRSADARLKSRFAGVAGGHLGGVRRVFEIRGTLLCPPKPTK